MANMVTALLLVFGLAALAPTLHRFLGRATGWCLASLPAGLFVYFFKCLLALGDRGVFLERMRWIPTLGIDLAFRFDGLSLLFLLLISGIGVLILVYAGGYLAGHPQLGRFYCFLLFFMGAMLGIVSSDNLLALFVFWELTSLSSYLLIGFNHEQEKSRKAALQALLVTFMGGQALLAGILLIGMVGGSYELSVLMQYPDVIRSNALYTGILILVLLGAFTKSAQTPFHFWLPGAMAAPTPVSAYLHSATMVTAGVFLLARLTPLLSETLLWKTIVIPVGALTMLVGAIIAISERDLKRLLAFSTVGALGIMTLLLGINSELAAKAAVLFLLVHSLYKGALFMVAGAVDHETGTRDTESLRGLYRSMPITAIAAGLGALAMCGMPPFLGFISKELHYAAKLHFLPWGGGLAFGAVLANGLMMAVALVVGFQIFYGRSTKTPKSPHEAPFAMWVGPLMLAVLGLFFGIVPSVISHSLIEPATEAIVLRTVDIHLGLWEGFTPMLGLSIMTILLGFLLFFQRKRLERWGVWMKPLRRLGPERWYEGLMALLVKTAEGQTRLIQHGSLRLYIMTVVGTATIAILLGMSRINFEVAIPSVTSIRPYEVVLAVLMIAAGILAAAVPGRLVSVSLLSVIGYGVAFIFATYGAPDLALTQFLVETLTLILLVIVLYHLPKVQTVHRNGARVLDVIVSVAAGVAVTLMVLQALSNAPRKGLTEYFTANVLLAQGRNVVNVILVDFRGLDTLGEITVLTVAALGVYALVHFGRNKS